MRTKLVNLMLVGSGPPGGWVIDWMCQPGFNVAVMNNSAGRSPSAAVNRASTSQTFSGSAAGRNRPLRKGPLWAQADAVAINRPLARTAHAKRRTKLM